MKPCASSRSLLVALVAFGVVACGANSTRAPVSPGFERVAHVHRSRCGSCHTRVEPGTRSRAELDLALARHHDRVRLSEEEWSKMLDYLAARETTGSLAGAHAVR